MTTDRTSLTLTAERRTLEDKLRGELGEALPDQQFRTTLYDMALTHLLDTLTNDVDEVPQRYRREFNTRVVKYRQPQPYKDIERPKLD